MVYEGRRENVVGEDLDWESSESTVGSEACSVEDDEDGD